MHHLVAKCGGKVVYTRWEGELETNRQEVIKKGSKLLMFCSMGPSAYKFIMSGSTALAAPGAGAEQIRKGFMQIIDVFTAIAEPILWFYALTACILMATGHNRDLGWNRLKSVGYAYIGIALLPTFFAFLRWMGSIIKGAINI